MVRIVIIGSIVCMLACLVTLTRAGRANASAEVIASWNAHCGDYGFEAYPVGGGETFAQAYFGPSFSSDFNALLDVVSAECEVQRAHAWGNDLMNATLEAWQ